MPEQASPENFRQDSTANSAAPGVSAADDQISLLDLLIVLAKHKKLILGLPFLFAVVVAGLTLLATNIFTATTKILPPQQSQSATSALLAQFAGLAGLAGGAAAGLKNPNDIYVPVRTASSLSKSTTKTPNVRPTWPTPTSMSS